MNGEDDPFERAAFRQIQGVMPLGGRKQGIASMLAGEYPGHVLKSLATLPARAFGAAGELQRTGEYDPGPATEATMMLLGIPGTPRGALGAMSLKPTGIPKGYPRDTPGNFFTATSDKRAVDPFPIHTVYDPQTKNLSIEWIGREDLKNKLGPSEVMSLLRELKLQYPEAQTIGGRRWSGAREENVTDIKMRLR